jgi:hypothetical protein
MPATWVVPPGQQTAYSRAGVHAEPIGSATSVAKARNAALEAAFEHYATCIMLDDDLTRLRWALKPGTNSVRELAFEDAATHIVHSLAEEPTCRLAGANSTDNAYFVRKAFSTRLFIPTAFMVVEPNPLRFDEQLPMREDYDYCCQHIEKFGSALRCNRVLPSFTYKTNSGGMQEHRTEETSERSIEILTAKWPQWIKRNPRRPGEVLMRVGKPQREVLA